MSAPEKGRTAERPPWLDRVIGDRTGDVLAWLAKRAKRRGDPHEFAHLYAAIVFGNSNHDGEWPCGLAYVEGYLSHRDDGHRTFRVVLDDGPENADPSVSGGSS